MHHDPRKWYWIVGGNEAQVYSSAVSNYVAASDQTYQDWIAAGGIATRIANEAELGAVLVPYSLRPIPPGVLQGYDDKIVGELDTMKIMRAFSLVMLDEINILRQQHSLPDRTVAQLKAAVRAKVT